MARKKSFSMDRFFRAFADHTRLRLRLGWQSRSRLWLSLRRPASLSLCGASFYSLRRRRDYPRLRRRHISNRTLRLLPLHSCLLLRRTTLLL